MTWLEILTYAAFALLLGGLMGAGGAFLNAAALRSNLIDPYALQDFIRESYRRERPDIDQLRMVVLPRKFGVTFPTLALGATLTQQIQIASNGDFFLGRISYRPSLAGAAQTVSTVPVPNVRALFTDSGSDEQWSNQPIDLSQWGQNGAGSFYMDELYPRFIGGKSTITVALTSFEAASTPIIDLTLHGVIVKLFSQ